MSERMSSVEIEDVLSSIRRLVSEDLRPAPRHLARVDTGSKLILTPALRVVTDDDTTSALVLAERARIEADFMTENDEAEGVKSDAVDAGSRLQTLLYEIAHGEIHASESDAPLPNPADSSGATPASIGAVVAALGAAVTGQGWEGEADEPEPAVDWSDSTWAERTLADVAEIGMDPAGLDPAGLDKVEDAEIFAESKVTTAAWSPDDIWLDAPKADAFAPDSSFLDDVEALSDQPKGLSETDLADRAEAAAVAEILSVGATVADDDSAGPAANEGYASVYIDTETASADEDQLRELVRDIIREELQGALGERITRNVRKLVRSEINRAIASRDFE